MSRCPKGFTWEMAVDFRKVVPVSEWFKEIDEQLMPGEHMNEPEVLGKIIYALGRNCIFHILDDLIPQW